MKTSITTTCLASFHRLWLIVRALPCLGCLALAPTAYGQVPQCVIAIAPNPVTFNPIAVDRNSPNGTALSEVTSNVIYVNCPTNDGVVRNNPSFQLRYYPALSVSSVISDVWQTPQQGVGIRVRSVNNGNQVLSTIGVGSFGQFAPQVTTALPFSGNYTFTYQLIKTGQISGSGTVNIPAMLNLLSYNVPSNRDSPIPAPVDIGNSPIAIKSCTVNTTNVGVTLPTISSSALMPVGATAGETGFQIGLTCDAGSTVYVTLTDATTPGNRTDRLTLTAASTAQGVQLRITRPTGEIVSFGPDSAASGTVNQILIGPSSSLSTIPLRVRYISTGTVTPGTVNALATFTLSYQ